MRALPLVVTAVLFAGWGASQGRLGVVEVERFGDLELLTHDRRERGGDASGYALMEVQHWSLRWRGEPLVLDSRGGLFGDQPQQARVVHAVFTLRWYQRF
jgi:hypothetical protein